MTARMNIAEVAPDAYKAVLGSSAMPGRTSMASCTSW